MKISKRQMYMLDMLLVGLSLVVVLGLVGYARPLVIAPADGLVTTDGAVLFVFEKAEIILLDDNIEFSSPEEIYAEDNLVINLEPGNYYWKVKGALSSEVRQLTVNDVVALQLQSVDEGYEVVNVGNVLLNVDVYENGSLAGSRLLDVEESEEVSGEQFIGGLGHQGFLSLTFLFDGGVRR